MSKGWQRSNLEIGEHIKVSSDIFIEPSKAVDRLIGTFYVGETEAGIIIDCSFRPAFGTKTSQTYDYKRMINWSSIWSGDIKVYDERGSLVVAKRQKGLPIAYEVIKQK